LTVDGLLIASNLIDLDPSAAEEHEVTGHNCGPMPTAGIDAQQRRERTEPTGAAPGVVCVHARSGCTSNPSQTSNPPGSLGGIEIAHTICIAMINSRAQRLLGYNLAAGSARFERSAPAQVPRLASVQTAAPQPALAPAVGTAGAARALGGLVDRILAVISIALVVAAVAFTMQVCFKPSWPQIPVFAVLYLVIRGLVRNHRQIRSVEPASLNASRRSGPG
jgi:hypothetical protein